MANKQVRTSRAMLFTWFVLAGLIFLIAPQKLTNKFQFAFARIFRLPLSIGRNVSLSAHTQQPGADAVSRSKYNKLQNQLANVTRWLRQERERVEKLSGLRNRSVWKGVNFVSADVVTASNKSHNTLIINRGKDDGLAKGQFVLGDYSIIGTIFEVDSRMAQVKLITDPTSKMAIKIGESDAGMIMQGSGNNYAEVPLVPIKHKVKVGDIVYARKRPGLLGVPMITAMVTQCKQDDETPLLWDITVEPACDITSLNEVDVIVMNPQK